MIFFQLKDEILLELSVINSWTERGVFPLQAAMLGMKLGLQKELDMEQVSNTKPSIPTIPVFLASPLLSLSDVCSSDPDGQADPGRGVRSGSR